MMTQADQQLLSTNPDQSPGENVVGQLYYTT